MDPNISFRMVENGKPAVPGIDQIYPGGIAYDFSVERVVEVEEETFEKKPFEKNKSEKKKYEKRTFRVTYFVPSPLYVLVANIGTNGSLQRSLVGATDLHFSPSHLNHLESERSKHAKFTEFRRQWIDTPNNVVVQGLSGLHIVMDLRISPHAGKFYEPTALPRITSPIPVDYTQPAIFREARKIEAVLPLLIKDIDDKTNWFYGSIKIIYEKMFDLLWKITLIEPYDQVVARDDRGSLRGHLQLLQTRVQRTNEVLPQAKLTAEDLGRLQIALTNVVDEMGSTAWQPVWENVKVKDVQWKHQEDIERKKMLCAEVKARGKDPIEFVRFLGNKSW